MTSDQPKRLVTGFQKHARGILTRAFDEIVRRSARLLDELPSKIVRARADCCHERRNRLAILGVGLHVVLDACDR